MKKLSSALAKTLDLDFASVRDVSDLQFGSHQTTTTTIFNENFKKLPSDVLMICFSFLGIGHFPRYSIICKSFHKEINSSDFLWGGLFMQCLKEFISRRNSLFNKKLSLEEIKKSWGDKYPWEYCPPGTLKSYFIPFYCTNQNKTTKAKGGTGGSAFNDFSNFDIFMKYDISEITFLTRPYSFIDEIRTVYLPSQIFPYCPQNQLLEPINAIHGSGNYDEKIFKLRKGEYLVSLEGRSGSLVDQVKFKTNLGNTFLCGGHGGCQFKKFNVPNGWKIAAFHGRSGDSLDCLGLILQPVCP